ncbi:energy-coupling factor transporter transmembrane component T family protein [Jeotgalibacillus proteolyticus]|uniref:energy-coupling factor transporter transmembrane component T family protein n=1 Tax=Jeotgalibacillus proteolyticus TaxID=2082395 RepID=UPI003CE7C72E
MQLLSAWREKLSVEYVKMELMKTAFGNRDTFLAKLDPRILIIWYLAVSIVPWFTFNEWILFTLVVFTSILAIISKVSPLILGLLSFGVVSEIGWITVVVLFFGGDITAFLALLTFTMKITIMSIASIAVFASMDPEKLSDALISFGVPAQFGFGVSYGYRMLPILLDEYQHIFQSFLMRGKGPEKKGLLGWRMAVYYGKIMVLAFYPMILNVAKRTRTTVEALEVRGFPYSLHSKEAKKQKLSYMKVGPGDLVFLGATMCFLLMIFSGIPYLTA